MIQRRSLFDSFDSDEESVLVEGEGTIAATRASDPTEGGFSLKGTLTNRIGRKGKVVQSTLPCRTLGQSQTLRGGGGG